MQSEYQGVHPFLIEKFGKVTGQIKKMTTGWGKEKKERQEHMYIKALEANEKAMIDKLQVPVSMIQKGKKNAILLLMKGLEKYVDKKGNITKDFDVGAIAKILDKLKTELKEPINITRQYNTEIKDDRLSEEEQMLIDKIEAERAKIEGKTKK